MAADDIFVTYSNWSLPSSEADAYMGAKLSASREGWAIDEFILYLVRSGQRNTLTININKAGARKLYDFLKEEFFSEDDNGNQSPESQEGKPTPQKGIVKEGAD